MDFYNQDLKTLQGEKFDLCEHQDKPILFVNTASKCGFTSQFEGLESLYRENKGNIMVVGFPSNDFNQELTTDKEIQDFGASGRVFIDKHCGVIEESHLLRDSKGELKEKIGSTGSGTGPANSDRAMRVLKMAKDFDSLSSLITDVPEEINSALDANQNVLVEGTQGTFLSLWHGTYPFVTSKDVTASGICADVGLGPTKVDEVIVVFKSYVTRVGTGPLDKELSLEDAEKKNWSEFGTVTGRQRRAADFDFDLARRAIMLNGATQISITKIDVLFTDCAGKTSYDELSDDAKSFIKNIENKLNTPVTIIGTGPAINDVVDRRN